MTMPGLTVGDGFGGTTGVAGHLRDTARRGLDEHDAEPLLLESAPPVAAEHREDVGTSVQQRQVGVRDAAEEPDRCIEFGRQPLAGGRDRARRRR